MYIYTYICNHENNVLSWLSPQWFYESCAQVDQLPQNHVGDNKQDGTLFSWLHITPIIFWEIWTWHKVGILNIYQQNGDLCWQNGKLPHQNDFPLLHSQDTNLRWSYEARFQQKFKTKLDKLKWETYARKVHKKSSIVKQLFVTCITFKTDIANLLSN